MTVGRRRASQSDLPTYRHSTVLAMEVTSGITAVAFSAHNSLIFWAGGLMVLFFGLSEMSYVDIQEDVMVRNRELEKLLDSLSRSEIGPEHHAYQFGLGKVFFGSGRMLRPRNALTWLSYRTFNPFLYGSLLCLMILAVFVAPVSGK